MVATIDGNWLQDIVPDISRNSKTLSDPAGIVVADLDDYGVLIITATSDITGLILPDPTDVTIIREIEILNDDDSLGSIEINSDKVEIGNKVSYHWDGDAWVKGVGTSGQDKIQELTVASPTLWDGNNGRKAILNVSGSSITDIDPITNPVDGEVYTIVISISGGTFASIDFDTGFYKHSGGGSLPRLQMFEQGSYSFIYSATKGAASLIGEENSSGGLYQGVNVDGDTIAFAEHNSSYWNITPNAGVANISIDPVNSDAFESIGHENGFTLIVTLNGASDTDTNYTFDTSWKDSEGVDFGVITIKQGESRNYSFYITSFGGGSQTLLGGGGSGDFIITALDASLALDEATASKTSFIYEVGSATTIELTAPNSTIGGVATYTASNHPEGTKILVSDSAAGEWDVEVIGATNDSLLHNAEYFPDNFSKAASGTTTGTEDMTNSEFTIPKSGKYDIDIQSNVSANGYFHIDGRIKLRLIDVTSGNVELADGEWEYDDDGATGGSNPNGKSTISFKHTVNLVASNDYKIEINWTRGGGTESSTGNNTSLTAQDNVVTVREVPSTESVLSGTVTPQLLDRVSLRVDDGGVNDVDNLIEWDNVNYDTNGLFDGTEIITIAQDGNYEINVDTSIFGDAAVDDFRYIYLVKNYNAGTEQSVYGNVNNETASMALPSYLAQGQAYSQNTEYQSVGINWMGDLVTGDTIAVFFAADNGTDRIRSGSINVKQLPISTIVMPDALEVEDVRTIEYSKTASLGFGPVYSLDNSRTWQDLKNDYEYLEFNFEVDITGVADDVLRTITIKTSDIRDDTRWRLEYGSGVVDVQPGVLTSGDWTFTGSTTDEIALEIVGVKAQKTVINTTDLPAAGVTAWTDGDFGVWNNGQFEPATVSDFSGTDVTNTLTQTSGTSWIIASDTTPNAGEFILNPDYAQYVQEGNKRHYSLRVYLDADSGIDFGVTGAKDIHSVTAVGFSLGSGDTASRMVQVRRIGVNSLTLNRDDDNNVDMFVDVTFTAIM